MNEQKVVCRKIYVLRSRSSLDFFRLGGHLQEAGYVGFLQRLLPGQS